MKRNLLFIAAFSVSLGTMAQTNKQVPQLKPEVKKKTAVLKNEADVPFVNQAVSENAVLRTGGPVSTLAATETVVGNTLYPLQSNRSAGNRVEANSDGTISVVWTFSATGGSAADRGTGYNYFDGSSWGTAPTSRVESTRTGWPSIAVNANNTESIISHNTALSELDFISRATKGTGTWTENTTALAGPAGAGNWWPRMTAGGANGNSLHVISLTYPTASGGTVYKGQDGAITYSRSQDAGVTWDIVHSVPAPHDSSNYFGFGGDAYAIDANGDVIAYVVGGLTNDLFLMKSTDNGSTWTKTVIDQFPIPMFDDDISDVNGDQVADTIDVNDGCVAVVIDNNNTAHVFAGLTRMLNLDSTDNSVSYFPGVNGLIYWNENMTGAPVIITGAEDRDNDGALNILDWGTYVSGLSSHPAAGVDTANNVYVAYDAVMENTDDGSGKSYRNIYVMRTTDGGNTWSAPINISPDDFSEKVYPAMDRNVTADCISIVYQNDDKPGHGTNGTDDLDNIGVTHDIIYACMPPSEFLVGINDSEELHGVSVYPNPASSNFTINISEPGKNTVSIINTVGIKVMELETSSENIQVNTENLAGGVYYVMISNGEKVAVKKIMISK